MIKEIGSEYNWKSFESGSGLRLPRPGKLVFSGRTAIKAVLEQIPEAKKALLPSYCCESMIQPFRDKGISVAYYPVHYSEGLKIDTSFTHNTDIILWCNYFGFKATMPEFTGFDGIIIEDITHSLLSDTSYHKQSQFIVASIRKWEPVLCGGYCAGVGRRLNLEPKTKPSEFFLNLKQSAMHLKTEYLEDPSEDKKTQFLSMFLESNRYLSENYSGFAIDDWSKEYLAHADIEEQKRIRRKNAATLYEGLQGKIQFLFTKEKMDCPLFVPIISEKRDEIRKHLIDKGIYCPVHWPKPKGCRSNLYDLELSLICDQRYDTEDMERIVSVISEIL